MGYWPDFTSVVITDVIGPGPNAKRDRFSFHPDVAHHDDEITRIYLASGRLHTYLGDWHTHPKGAARMSPKDRKTLRAIASDPFARAPRPLMAILAGSQNWNIGVWSMESYGFLWASRVALARVRLFDWVG